MENMEFLFVFSLPLCNIFLSLFSYDWCVSNVCFSMLVNFNDYTVLKFSINIILPSSGLMKAFKKSFIEEPFCIQYIRDVSSGFSSNSEDFASELLEYLDDMFPLYYILQLTVNYFITYCRIYVYNVCTYLHSTSWLLQLFTSNTL